MSSSRRDTNDVALRNLLYRTGTVGEFGKYARNHARMRRANPIPMIENAFDNGTFMFDMRYQESRIGKNRNSSTIVDSSPDEDTPGSLAPITKAEKLAAEDRLHMNWDEESLHVVDYLSRDEWFNHVCMMTDPDRIPTRSLKITGLDTILKPWQEIGVSKILEAFKCPLRGLILADETGLGKTLTALVAAVEKRKEMLPDCGPILVVCRPGCVNQWYEEVQTHFSKGDRPQVIILDRCQTAVTFLLNYDIVICSNSFLKSRFTDIVKQQIFTKTVYAYDIQRARDTFPEIEHRRIDQPLHSKLYSMLNKNFAVVIIDEAHDARNCESQLQSAIRSLECHYVILLTATPIYNSWNDLGGMVLMLPGTPLESFEHFRRVFSVKAPDLGEVGRQGPQGHFLSLFTHFFRGVILARPKEVLRLEPYQEYHIQVEARLPRIVELTVTAWAVEGHELIWGKQAFGQKNPKRKAQVKKGFRKFRRAQQLASHEALLFHEGSYEEGVHKRAEFFATVTQKLELIIIEWCLKTGLPPTVSLDDMTSDQYHDFHRWFRESWSLKLIDLEEEEFAYQRDDVAESQDSQPASQGNKTVSAYEADSVVFESTTQILRADHQSICNARNSDDDKAQDDASSVSESEHTTNNGSNHIRHCHQKRSVAQSLRMWKECLQTIPTPQLVSPKVKAIADLIEQLHLDHSTERVIVASASVKFLDMVKEYLNRKSPKLRTIDFNGSIKSMDERTKVAQDFNRKCGEYDVLFLSASSGGPGLNLHGGSRMILAEPFWAPGLTKQVIGRVDRIPQTRKVHVYHILMDTELDNLVRTVVQKKVQVADPFIKAIRRSDTAPCVIHKLPSREVVQEELFTNDATWERYVAKKAGNYVSLEEDSEENSEYSDSSMDDSDESDWDAV